MSQHAFELSLLLCVFLVFSCLQSLNISFLLKYEFLKVFLTLGRMLPQSLCRHNSESVTFPALAFFSSFSFEPVDL